MSKQSPSAIQNLQVNPNHATYKFVKKTYTHHWAITTVHKWSQQSLRCLLLSPHTVPSPRGTRCFSQYLLCACAIPRASDWRIFISVSSFHFTSISCFSICPFSLFCFLVLLGIQREVYQRLQHEKCSKTKKPFSQKLLSSKVRSVIKLLWLCYKSAIFFTCNLSVYLSVTRT